MSLTRAGPSPLRESVAATLRALLDADDAQLLEDAGDDLVPCRRAGRRRLLIGLPSGRAWLVAREDRDFDEPDVRRALGVRPLLIVLGQDADDHDHLAAVWARLSPRERQVVDLLVAGLTARRMGAVLGISPRTVGKHLQNAYDKLGEHDRLVIALQHRQLEHRSHA